MRATILKLYLANFFIGLIFWYGIEKLFMQTIGIDATQIGIVIAAVLGFNLLFDIPSGIIADRWSSINPFLDSDDHQLCHPRRR